MQLSGRELGQNELSPLRRPTYLTDLPIRRRRRKEWQTYPRRDREACRQRGSFPHRSRFANIERAAPFGEASRWSRVVTVENRRRAVKEHLWTIEKTKIVSRLYHDENDFGINILHAARTLINSESPTLIHCYPKGPVSRFHVYVCK